MGRRINMSVKPILPIGIDNFRKIRQENYYYVDKTLMIKEFLELRDEVALIARPRRFGKTLNMTMLRDFFDITQDSQEIFDGLAIMDTEYADQINSRPVIFFTFKNAKGTSIEEFAFQLRLALRDEYGRYEAIFRGKLDPESMITKSFYEAYNFIVDASASYAYLSSALVALTKVVYEFYQIPPVLLIDEYDQPIMNSYEQGYHDILGKFFSNLYGNAMKSNTALGRALLTGVQRVAKESIFSQFNNVQVYTVMHEQYAPYFGLTMEETANVLADYEMVLDETVQKKYNGYHFGGIQMYNPWSVLNYAKMKMLDNYWVNTSTNFLVKQAIREANQKFWKDFDHLVTGEQMEVEITLETSYLERDDNNSLWGLLVNSGYLTAMERVDEKTAIVKIPNEEVLSEFQTIVTSIAGMDGLDLKKMFSYLLKKDMEGFISIYRMIVTDVTSFMDAKENAYHMLFLGMAMTMRGVYRLTSNRETGLGRSDIILESQSPKNSHMIIEFKQGEQIEKLAKEALEQILTKQYYAGLKGEVICIGLAHDKKECQMIYKIISN